ncbi:MAG: hypothetical protein ACOC5R_00740 [Elusimicrobiota bacterium]
MPEKKLISGSDLIISKGGGIVIALGLTAAIDSTVFGIIAGVSAFVICCLLLSVLMNWFKNSYAAVISITIIGVYIGSLYLIFGTKSIDEVQVMILVISITYLLFEGTDNFSRKINIYWSAGCCLGYIFLVGIMGVIRNTLADGTGFAFLSAAGIISFYRAVVKND